MNWFERYGIVGMFFIIMTGMWVFCLFPEETCELFSKINSKQLKFIGGFCVLSFLPLGYIIMIFSQLLCYSKRDIHCRYWQDLCGSKIKKDIQEKEKEKELGELSEKDQNNEAKMEAILSYYDRKYFSCLETNKFISSFATKRFDVVAINWGLIWALLFSFVAAICIRLIILDVPTNWNTFLFVFALALLIFCVLYKSQRKLKEQIFEIGMRKFKDLILTKKE